MKAEGTLNEEIQGAAKLALAEYETLKAKGYRDHEAEEVILHQFVYLKPEPGVDDEEDEELAELERKYRANLPWQATMHDHEETDRHAGQYPGRQFPHH